MKSISWQRMLELRNVNIDPFCFKFTLVNPVDKGGDIFFGNAQVKHFKRKTPYCSGGLDNQDIFPVVSCDSVSVEVV